MMNCNPIYYLKHAWEGTNSIWGKLCIVLFYSFLWLQIIGCVWSLFAPVYGTGWDCLWETAMHESDVNFVARTMKVSNLWILGFFLYADRGGIKFWNVFMVAFFYLVQWLMYKPTITEFLQDKCPDELSQFNTSMIVTEIWIFLALLCSLVDSRIGAKQGTAEETQSLVV